MGEEVGGEKEGGVEIRAKRSESSAKRDVSGPRNKPIKRFLPAVPRWL